MWSVSSKQKEVASSVLATSFCLSDISLSISSGNVQQRLVSVKKSDLPDFSGVTYNETIPTIWCASHIVLTVLHKYLVLAIP